MNAILMVSKSLQKNQVQAVSNYKQHLEHKNVTSLSAQHGPPMEDFKRTMHRVANISF